MAATRFDCQFIKPGLYESAAITMDADNPVNVAYEAEKCVSAWIEYVVNGITGRIRILPFDKKVDIRNPQLPNGAVFKIVASVGNGGFFKGFVYY